MAQLDDFLGAAKAKGADDASLVALLKDQGWPEKELYAALGRYYEQATGVAIPVRGRAAESARDAFLHLLSFATLATWITSAGSIWFELIDVWFRDPLYENVWRSTRLDLTFQLAAILVAFPTYLWTMRTLLREQQASEAKRESGVKKWLTWLASFLAAGIVIGDLIAVLAFFFKGEVTARFILKALTVFVLAGGSLIYYAGSIARAKQRGEVQ
jgi:hypothetical protein